MVEKDFSGRKILRKNIFPHNAQRTRAYLSRYRVVTARAPTAMGVLQHAAWLAVRPLANRTQGEPFSVPKTALHAPFASASRGSARVAVLRSERGVSAPRVPRKCPQKRQSQPFSSSQVGRSVIAHHSVNIFSYENVFLHGPTRLPALRHY